MGIIDCHCDVISRIWREGESIYSNQGQFDIRRAQATGVILQFCALFTQFQGEATLRIILNQIDKYHQELLQYPDAIYPVNSYQDIEQNQGNGKVGTVLHLEGGEALGRDAGILRLFYQLGLRSLGLTWNHRNLLGDGVMEDAGGGISDFGREVIKLAQELGIVIDLAHLSSRGFLDVIEMVERPVIVSHANARRLCDHPRNLTDHQLKILADNGGIVGCTLVPFFVCQGEAHLEDFIDHIAYISDLVGVEHVALGSDFDGVEEPVLANVAEYQLLEPALRARGFNQEETDKILKTNGLQFLSQVMKSH